MKISREVKNDDSYPLSSLWIIVYLTLQMFWIQLVSGAYVSVYLRVGFLSAVIMYLLFQHRSILSVFIGTTRPSLRMLTLFAAITLLIRAILFVIFPFKGNQIDLSYIFDQVLIPVFNEEIVFRSLFLGILCRSLFLKPFPAVLISSMIFTVSHNLYNISVLHLLILGGICGYAYLSRGGGLLAAIVVHATWNLFPLLVGHLDLGQ